MVIYLSREKSIKSYYRLPEAAAGAIFFCVPNRIKCSNLCSITDVAGRHLNANYEYVTNNIGYLYKYFNDRQSDPGRHYAIESNEWERQDINWERKREPEHTKLCRSSLELSKSMQFGHIRSKQANLNARECEFGYHSAWMNVIARRSYRIIDSHYVWTIEIIKYSDRIESKTMPRYLPVSVKWSRSVTRCAASADTN